MPIAEVRGDRAWQEGLKWKEVAEERVAVDESTQKTQPPSRKDAQRVEDERPPTRQAKRKDEVPEHSCFDERDVTATDGRVKCADRRPSTAKAIQACQSENASNFLRCDASSGTGDCTTEAMADQKGPFVASDHRHGLKHHWYIDCGKLRRRARCFSSRELERSARAS